MKINKLTKYLYVTMLITIGLDFPRPRILHQLPCNRARRNINLEINPTASSEKHRDAHLVCSL